MSVPTSPCPAPVPASEARTEWLRPNPLRPARPMILPSRSRVTTVLNIAARIGTAVTLAALLVVTGSLLTMVDAQPVPTGASSTGR
jgi:hypothetical protein